MTANKNRKRLIRQRTRRTGESYATARRYLSAKWDEELTMDDLTWRRIEKPEYGYAVHVPKDWEERPPNLKNSPWDTARFVHPDDRRHLCGVLRRPVKPGDGPAEMAEGVRAEVEAGGFADFEQREIVIAGRPGVQLDFARWDAGRVWAISEHFVVENDIGFCLAVGTSIPEEDADLLIAIAQGFELLPTD